MLNILPFFHRVHYSGGGGGSNARLGGRELTLLCGFNQYTLLQNRDNSGLLSNPVYCSLTPLPPPPRYWHQIFTSAQNLRQHPEFAPAPRILSAIIPRILLVPRISSVLRKKWFETKLMVCHTQLIHKQGIL